jgi:hypothetical protein
MPKLELSGEPTTLLLYGTEIGVTASKPAPPGARVDATAIADDEGRSPFRIKVHRCKKQADGTFVLVGVTIDLRREGRAVLEELGRVAPGLPKGI